MLRSSESWGIAAFGYLLFVTFGAAVALLLASGRSEFRQGRLPFDPVGCTVLAAFILLLAAVVKSLS